MQKSNPNAADLTGTAIPRPISNSGFKSITCRPFDSPGVKRKSRFEMLRCRVFRGFFCQEDRRISLDLVRHLCSGGIPTGLLPEFQKTMSRCEPVKLCPKCNIPFSDKTERYLFCGKSSQPYNIYECQECKDQNRIGEYSDLERLRPESSKMFQNLTTDIRLVEWSQKDGRWRLEARGICWTRCDEPTCCALYKYNSGARSRRTVAKHNHAISKAMVKSPLELNSGDTRIDSVPALSGIN